MPDRPELKKVRCSFGFFASLGALVSSPGAPDPRAGDKSQFPAVLRVGSKFKFTFSSSMGRGLNLVSRGAEPKSQRCRYPGATDGRHGRCRAKGCPQIGSQHMQQGYTHPLQGLLRRRLWPERATPHFVSARAYSAASGADTSDSLRCDARSTRGAAGTRAPPHLTCAPHACAQFGYAPRVADQRRRCGRCKQALGVVAPAPASAFA